MTTFAKLANIPEPARKNQLWDIQHLCWIDRDDTLPRSLTGSVAAGSFMYPVRPFVPCLVWCPGPRCLFATSNKKPRIFWISGFCLVWYVFYTVIYKTPAILEYCRDHYL